MDPEMAVILRSLCAQVRRPFKWIIPAFGVFGLLLSIFIVWLGDFMGGSHIGRNNLQLLLVMGPCMAVGGVLMMGGMYTFLDRLFARDLRGMSYFRTTGPVALAESNRNPNVYFLRLVDHSFMVSKVDQYGAFQALAPLDWATVDYNPHVKVIFRVADRDGREVFRRTASDGTS